MEPQALPDACDVSVVICTRNRPGFLQNCLTCLARQHCRPAEIVVVDNGSAPGSVARIRDAFPQIAIHELGENRGFAGGVNHALRDVLASPSSYVLLLNSDTVLPAGSITALVAAMQQRPEVGIATPKIYYTDSSRRLWGIGGTMLPHWMLVHGMDELDDGQYDTHNFDFVFGCAMIIRREVIETIGLFDERFFFYYEDTDYCLRARAAGFAVALLPDISVWHDGSYSTEHVRPWRTFLHIRSRMIFFFKYLGYAARWCFFARESLYIASVIGRSLRRGEFDNIAWYLKGLVQGIALGSAISHFDTQPAAVHDRSR
jgi:GT2 family glycosyltransferase